MSGLSSVLNADYAERAMNFVAGAGVVAGVAYNLYAKGPAISATEWLFDAIIHGAHLLPEDSSIRKYAPVLDAVRVYQIFSLGSNATIDPNIGYKDSLVHLTNVALTGLGYLRSTSRTLKKA